MFIVVRVFVSGFVQGVGFRQFIKSHALKLGVTGWVKNLPDGKVEILLEGEESNIEKMIKHSKSGPFLAEVKNVQIIKEKDKLKAEGFEIIK